MSPSRKIVLLATASLLCVWFSANWTRLSVDHDTLTMVVLGVIFGLSLILRQKPGVGKAETQATPARGLVVLFILGAIAFMLTAVTGQIFGVHQLQWLSLILLVYVALRWAFPAHYGKDIALAVFLFYWVHPLPQLVFGPLQLQMQLWSVMGAEWALHCLNVAVWADSISLYNGFQQITVPAICSGLKTGIVVAFSVLGVGLIFRLAWFEILIFGILGLGQVLLMNMARIAGVTKMAPDMNPAWNENFLHDTLGLLLLSTILVVQLELAFYRAIKSRRHEKRTGIASGELEKKQSASPLPRFWHLLFRWGGVIVLIMLTTAAIVGVAYKSRPLHRQEMRKPVIDGLAQTDLEKAEQLAQLLLAREPAGRELLGKYAHILVKRYKFEDALAVFDRITTGLSPFETVLKSSSLMSLGKHEQAILLLDALPPHEKQLPGVAILRAEYAAYIKDTPRVSKYLLLAAHSDVESHRIRAFFPYLARHEQWKTITLAEPTKEAFPDAGIAEIVMYAQLRMGDVDGLERTMKRVLRQYPDEPAFLRGMFSLAAQRPGSEWEERFAQVFDKSMTGLQIEEIVNYMSYCFLLHRPDLGWRAYLQLLDQDSEHPDLNFTPAQFGNSWFVFKRKRLGVGGSGRSDVIDLRPVVSMTASVWPFRRLWENVPLREALSKADIEPYQGRYLSSTLERLKQSEADGSLTRRDRVIYPMVLAAIGETDLAHKKIDELMDAFPDLKERALLQHAELYDREFRWQESIETLNAYNALSKSHDLKADLFYINALLNLNCEVGAIQVTREAAARFPNNDRIPVVEAAIWDVFGYDEHAYHLVKDRTESFSNVSAARLSSVSGRLNESERLHAVLGVPFKRSEVGKRQRLLELRAEFTVTRERWAARPTEADMDAEAEEYKRLTSTSMSPFFKALYQRSEMWLRRRGDGEISRWKDWEGIGRNPVEKVGALHQLAILSARHGKFPQAITACEQALRIVPVSPSLHRLMIALTEGDATRVAAAVNACPSDPDVWLASLVRRISEGQSDEDLRPFVEAAVSSDVFPAGSLVRAGDLCLRNGLLETARMISVKAIREARGLISAYILGLQCALQLEDAEWASEVARKGIENAYDPTLFYKAVVSIKTAQEDEDADLVSALEFLRKQFPDQPIWSERLVSLSFNAGDMRKAMTILEPIMMDDVKELRVQSVRKSAEAARLEGEPHRAIRILEKALEAHPEDLSLLNNLVYTLTQVPEGLPRARMLLPRLLDSGNNSFTILDTIAMVYLRSGDLDRARDFMDEAIRRLDDNDYSAAETRLNEAELLFAMGRYEEARLRTEAVRRRAEISGMLDARAKRLLDEIRSQQARNPQKTPAASR